MGKAKTDRRKGKTPSARKRDMRSSNRKVDDYSKSKPGIVDKDETYNCQTSQPNDWRWYAQNEQLLRDSASYPYSWPLGTKLNLGEDAPVLNRGSVPGVMAIYTSATFGNSNNPNSPINVAARNIYSFVRHANSGSANYDAPDLMLYLMAMDSAYSMIAHLKRIYGVVNTFSYTNRYYPKAVVNALGADYDDIAANLADFRAGINALSVKIGSMCIPASMSYFAKHMWMYSGLYADADQDKAQTYLFTPLGYYVYTLDADEAGALGFKRMPYVPALNNTTGYNPVVVGSTADGTLMTHKQLLQCVNDIINPILSSEDMNIMSGDILKAFGRENLYKLEMLEETYTVIPAYNMEVLDQIQNATLVGDYNVSFGLRQDASKGWLVATPSFAHPWPFNLPSEENPGQNAFICDRFVNFQHGDISPANTMEATRMTNILTEATESGTEAYYCYTLGSEVAHFAHIYYYANGTITSTTSQWNLYRTQRIYVGVTQLINFSSQKMENVVANMTQAQVTQWQTEMKAEMNINFINARTAVAAINLLAEQLTMFDRHPFVAITTGIQDVNTGTMHTAPAYGNLNAFLGDIAYYAIVTAADLSQMAETALLSEFNVTQYGRKQ